MATMKPSEISTPDTPANQSRREALKKFGRYAAAAPTAMVLLQPRESDAALGQILSRRRRRPGDSHY